MAKAESQGGGGVEEIKGTTYIFTYVFIYLFFVSPEILHLKKMPVFRRSKRSAKSLARTRRRDWLRRRKKRKSVANVKSVNVAVIPPSLLKKNLKINSTKLFDHFQRRRSNVTSKRREGTRIVSYCEQTRFLTNPRSEHSILLLCI